MPEYRLSCEGLLRHEQNHRKYARNITVSAKPGANFEILKESKLPNLKYIGKCLPRGDVVEMVAVRMMDNAAPPTYCTRASPSGSLAVYVERSNIRS